MGICFYRLVIGLAGGAYTVVPNIYIAECAEADIRWRANGRVGRLESPL